jgi:hypothetical protein
MGIAVCLVATGAVAASAAAANTASVSMSLSVVACKAYNTGLAGVPGVPGKVKVTLPAALAGKLRAYADGVDFMVLAPEGWTCRSTYGDDGSGALTVVPPPKEHLSGEEVDMHQTDACAGCAMGQACPLFSSAPTAYKAKFGPCPIAKPAREKIVKKSLHIIYFEDPPGVKGDGDSSGGPYPDNGVMTYYGGSQIASLLTDCTLPNNEHQMCAVILDQFVSWWGKQ